MPGRGPDRRGTCAAGQVVLCELIGQPIKQSAKLFGEPIKGRVQTVTWQSTAVQVVFLGLDVVVPLISVELLKVPKLCRLYFQLLGYLLELFPERMATLPGGLAPSR